MTYCLSLLRRGGLVFIHYTRMNAGVDNVNFCYKNIQCRWGELFISLTEAMPELNFNSAKGAAQ